MRGPRRADGRKVSAPESGPDRTVPWFSVTMTVRNNVGSIDAALESVVPQCEGAEVVIVDAVSTDGTSERLATWARQHPEVRVWSEPCNRGRGRNLAVQRSRAPVVLTQVDADNRYADGVLSGLAAKVRDDPTVDVGFAVGLTDRDPSVSRFYAWRRSAFDRAGGYPDRQEREDPPLLLAAFRAGLTVRRFAVPEVAEDLKARHGSRAPEARPWGRGGHAMRAARRFRVLGFSYGEYLRLLWLTRRTTSRFVAGVGAGTVGYLIGGLRRDGPEVLELQPEDHVAHVPPRSPGVS